MARPLVSAWALFNSLLEEGDDGAFISSSTSASTSSSAVEASSSTSAGASSTSAGASSKASAGASSSAVEARSNGSAGASSSARTSSTNSRRTASSSTSGGARDAPRVSIALDDDDDDDDGGHTTLMPAMMASETMAAETMAPETMAPETAAEWAEETMRQLPGGDALTPPPPPPMPLMETELVAETIPQLWTAAEGSSGETLPQLSSSQPEEETQVQPVAAAIPAWARAPSAVAYTFGSTGAQAPRPAGVYVLGTRADDTAVVTAPPPLPLPPPPAPPPPQAAMRAQPQVAKRARPPGEPIAQPQVAKRARPPGVRLPLDLAAASHVIDVDEDDEEDGEEDGEEDVDEDDDEDEEEDVDDEDDELEDGGDPFSDDDGGGGGGGYDDGGDGQDRWDAFDNHRWYRDRWQPGRREPRQTQADYARAAGALTAALAPLVPAYTYNGVRAPVTLAPPPARPLRVRGPVMSRDEAYNELMAMAAATDPAPPSSDRASLHAPSILFHDTVLPGNDGRTDTRRSLASYAVPSAAPAPSDRPKAFSVPAAGPNAKAAAIVPVRSLAEMCKVAIAAHLDEVVTFAGFDRTIARELILRALPRPGRAVPLHIFERFAECCDELGALDLRNRIRVPLDRVTALGHSLKYLALDNCGLAKEQLGVLARCPSLKWLSIAQNELNSVGHFTRPYGDPAQRASLCRLDHLDVRFNLLTDHDTGLLLPLRIPTLVLTGNPITDTVARQGRQAGYRALETLPRPPQQQQQARRPATLLGAGAGTKPSAPPPEGWPAAAAELELARQSDLLAHTLLKDILNASEAVPPPQPPGYLYRQLVLQAGAVAAAPVLQPVAANVLPQRRITPDELGRKKLFAN